MNIFEDDIVTSINLKDFEKIFSPEIKQVIEAIRKYGFDLRVVGGAVRDFILGKEPRDVDFVTDADPAELILIFDLEGIEYDAGGIEHGTVKAVFGSDKIDVTSIAYKIEIDDQDNMQIIRGEDWEEDAHGRDLTINSMSLDLDGNIHDYLHSMDDLKEGVIRLNPSQYEKIEKHPEIIMRWFKALLYFDNPKWPEKDFQFIRKSLPLLSKVKDDDRIARTLATIIANPNGRKILDFMCKLGVNQYIELSCD